MLSLVLINRKKKKERERKRKRETLTIHATVVNIGAHEKCHIKKTGCIRKKPQFRFKIEWLILMRPLANVEPSGHPFVQCVHYYSVQSVNHGHFQIYCIFVISDKQCIKWSSVKWVSCACFWPPPKLLVTSRPYPFRGNVCSAPRLPSRCLLSRPELSVDISSYLNSSRCLIAPIPYVGRKFLPHWRSNHSRISYTHIFVFLPNKQRTVLYIYVNFVWSLINRTAIMTHTMYNYVTTNSTVGRADVLKTIMTIHPSLSRYS